MTGNERFDKWGRLPGGFWRECQGGPRSLKDGAKTRAIRLQRPRWQVHIKLSPRDTTHSSARISTGPFLAFVNVYTGDARGNLPKYRYRRLATRENIPRKPRAREYAPGFKNRNTNTLRTGKTLISLRPFVFRDKILKSKRKILNSMDSSCEILNFYLLANILNF